MYEVFVLDPHNEAIAAGKRPYGEDLDSFLAKNVFILIAFVFGVGILFSEWVDDTIILVCGPIFIVWFGFWVWALLGYFFIERKLEKYGHLIEGEIRSCKSRTLRNRTCFAFEVMLEYSFQSPNGHEITSETTQTANHLDEYTIPSPGTPLAIWYVNDKTYTVL